MHPQRGEEADRLHSLNESHANEEEEKRAQRKHYQTAYDAAAPQSVPARHCLFRREHERRNNALKHEP